MEYADLPKDYIKAEGPDGLRSALDNLLINQASPSQYILYQLGNQQSLIKVDLSTKPFQFWYYDLLGRPATRIVKETLARFAWEKGGEQEWYLQELEKGVHHD
ncbi:MAG: hypothetical protein WAW86_10085 [Gammaproteobacteria bacterium]